MMTGDKQQAKLYLHLDQQQNCQTQWQFYHSILQNGQSLLLVFVVYDLL
jgi:hypothetical protein